MSEVSSTRLYLGNLPRNVTKQDIEDHFNSHGSGKITEIKLMTGFGFIEYEDAMDAKDVVPAFHGTDFKGERLTVQFARGPRRKEAPGPPERPSAPRPRRTIYRMQLTGLPETSWQDLKDFARQSGLDVVYSETGRDHDGRGFVEFETLNDLKTAVDKLNGRDFKGCRVTCTQDIQTHDDYSYRDPYRSRSPIRRGGYPPYDDYDRRFPPRGYSPRGHYRERSPPSRRDYYDRDGYGRRTPPPRSRIDDYLPPRRPYDDPYDYRGPPPRHYDDPYISARPYGRPPPRSPPPRGDYGGYDRRAY